MDKIVQGAISEGIERIVENHPRFKDQQQNVMRHVDRGKLRNGLQSIEQYIRKLEESGKEISPEQEAQIKYESLAKYVASGGAFDNAGKELILRQSLTERAIRRPRGPAARQLGGEQYLDKVGVAFRQLYDMFKSGDYAQHMPEVAKAVSTVYSLGFLSPAVDLMYHSGLMNEKRYAILKENIHARVREGTRVTEEAMQKYGVGEEVREEKYSQKNKENGKIVNANFEQQKYRPGKVAAMFLGVTGIIIMLFSGLNYTGGVIGASSVGGILSFAGIFLCIAAWLLLVRARRSKIF